LVHEEIRSILNSKNACYDSVENLLPFHLLSKNLQIKLHKTIILHFVFNGCETWFLLLREEHRLRVYEKRMLRIFGPKREEEIRGWTKQHNKEIHSLYASPNIIQVIKSRGLR
jgi:hypothetical protein